MAKINTRVTLHTSRAVAMIKAASNDALTDMGNQALQDASKHVPHDQGTLESKKYRAYFVKTRLYKRWKDNVDTILKTDGYDEVIVEN